MSLFNPPKAAPLPEVPSQTSPEVEAEMAAARLRAQTRKGRSASLIAGALAQRRQGAADMTQKELLGA